MSAEDFVVAVAFRTRGTLWLGVVSVVAMVTCKHRCKSTGGAINMSSGYCGAAEMSILSMVELIKPGPVTTAMLYEHFRFKGETSWMQCSFTDCSKRFLLGMTGRCPRLRTCPGARLS